MNQTPFIIPNSNLTLMYAEAAESSNVVKRQIDSQTDQFIEIGKYLRQNPPNSAIMVGRGSSDHAGVYARYLIEIMQGVITSPAGLSISSLYNSRLKAENSLCLAISQSGKSPDLVAAISGITEVGGHVIALTNVPSSPISQVADRTLSLCAGPEKSVAATKSYITSLSAVVQILAHWSQDTELLAQIDELPILLQQAWNLDWSDANEAFIRASSLFVLGRGVGFGITKEAALKFKETCSIHAEAYSAAEVLHGPAAIVKEEFPILVFAQDDETKPQIYSTIDTLSKTGCKIYTVGISHPNATELPSITAHPILQPILMIQSFYRFVNSIAVARGYNPDEPPNLSKVTETK